MVFCELGFAFSSRCVFSTHLGFSWFALDRSLLLVLYFGNLDLFISYLMVTISLKSLIYEEVGQQKPPFFLVGGIGWGSIPLIFGIWFKLF